MRLLILALLTVLVLPGCALFRAAAVSAPRAAVTGDVAAARSLTAGMSASGSTAQAARALFVSPKAAATGRSFFGPTFADVTAGRHALVIDSSGGIFAGAQRIVTLRGRRFYAGDEMVAHLGRGIVTDAATGQTIGRLSAVMPRTALLEINGVTSPAGRSLLVDIVEMGNARYLVRTQGGMETWLPAAALFPALLAVDDEASCTPEAGAGVLIRRSGEPVEFQSCQDIDGVYVLEARQGVTAIDADEAHFIASGDLLATFVRDTSAHDCQAGDDACSSAAQRA